MTADLSARQTGSVVTPISYITKSSNGGGTAQILGNRLDLLGSGGARSAILDHNFIDSQLTQNGGFSMCMTVTPLTETARFALALGQTSSDAGASFPTTHPGTDIGLRLTANLGAAPNDDSNTDFVGVYDSNPQPGDFYQLLMTVTTDNFASGTGFAADLFIDDAQIGSTFNSSWDSAGDNYISFSALDGRFAMDDLKIFAGLATSCGT